MLFRNRNTMPREAAPEGAMRMVRLSSNAHAKAREVAPGWDVYHLEQEWRSWMSEGGLDAPMSPDKAFVGFCRKWFERRGRP